MATRRITTPKAGRTCKGPSLGESLSTLLDVLVQTFTACEPGKLSAMQLAGEARTFARACEKAFTKKGEASYVAKRSAEFLVESLQMALRRVQPSPPDQALVLEHLLQSILDARTAFKTEAELDTIQDLYRSDKELVETARKKYGPQLITVPGR